MLLGVPATETDCFEPERCIVVDVPTFPKASCIAAA